MTRRELIEHCLAHSGTYEDYPFDDANWCVIRHRANKKGFAHIYERNGRLCVNLKCEPLEADILRQSFLDVTPAYHMNHAHWNTVITNGDVPVAELSDMIARSYNLTRPTAKRGKEAALLMDIYNRMRVRYGDPNWWPGETPYEIIVGAVLTQNTAWGNVERAISNFDGSLYPEYVMSLGHEALAEIIRPAGFFNQKAAYLKNVTSWFEQYDYSVTTVAALPMERVRAELLALRGIGKETADDILLYAFGFPSFVVDAYTMRLLKRIPVSAGRNYDAVKAYVEAHLPCDEKLFNEFHALIVLNAKAHCRKKPLCYRCPLMDLCKRKYN